MLTVQELGKQSDSLPKCRHKLLMCIPVDGYMHNRYLNHMKIIWLSEIIAVHRSCRTMVSLQVMHIRMLHHDNVAVDGCDFSVCLLNCYSVLLRIL